MYKFIFVLLLCFGQNLVFAEKAGKFLKRENEDNSSKNRGDKSYTT